jgi:hypothetical protein
LERKNLLKIDNMFEDKLKVGQMAYLTSQTSLTKIIYIKQIDGEDVTLDNGLIVKAKSINDIIKINDIIIKFK